MNDKPLDPSELDLLEIIRTLHAEKGPFLRSTLSVVGRGRGLEVARPLARLKLLGLVEEYERRPFRLLRLFGVRSSVFLRPTAAAFSLPEVRLHPEPAPAVGPDAAIDVLAVEASAVATPADAVPTPEAPDGQAPLVAAAAVEAPSTEGPAAEAVSSAPEEVIGAADVAPEAAAPPLAPEPLVAEPPPAPPASVAPLSAALSAPVSAPVSSPLPAPVPAQPRPAAARSPSPPRFAPDAYTDELGGKPLIAAPPPAAFSLDPELLEGLSEMIAVLGLEMTFAAETLIADRIAAGASAGEALSQVALFAFAHAAHYDILGGGTVDAVQLRDYAIAVMKELEKLRDAGEIAPEPFERDMRAIWALVDKDSDRSALVDQLLSDPVGGAAPPALLPEELRGFTEDDEDE